MSMAPSTPCNATNNSPGWKSHRRRECRILSNARCPVRRRGRPPLDAVLFLHPATRSSTSCNRWAGSCGYRRAGLRLRHPDPSPCPPGSTIPSLCRQSTVQSRGRCSTRCAPRRTFRRHDQQPGAQIQADTKTGQGNNRLLGAHIGPSTDDPDTDSEGCRRVPGHPDGVISLGVAGSDLHRIVDKVGTRVCGTNGPPTSPTSPDPRSPESTPSSATATPILRCASSLMRFLKRVA